MNEKDLTIVALGAVAIAAIGVALSQKNTIRNLKFSIKVEKITADTLMRSFSKAVNYIKDDELAKQLEESVKQDIRIAVIEMENLL